MKVASIIGLVISFLMMNSEADMSTCDINFVCQYYTVSICLAVLSIIMLIHCNKSKK